MDNEQEEVERDYIEFRKEVEEGEKRKSEKQLIKKTDNRKDSY